MSPTDVIADSITDYCTKLDSSADSYSLEQILSGDLHPMKSTPHTLCISGTPTLMSVKSAVKTNLVSMMSQSLMSTTQHSWLPTFVESSWIADHTVDRIMHPAPLCGFMEDCRMDSQASGSSSLPMGMSPLALAHLVPTVAGSHLTTCISSSTASTLEQSGSVKCQG